MKKHKLFWEEDYDFDLIGICSSYTDYRLCWTINNALSIQLQKGEDYALKNKKDGEFFFSFYEYIDEETRTAFFLVKNQSYNYKKLIPEQDKIDYFLIIKDNYNNDIQQLVSNIKTIESVMTAFVFDVQELKSKANLIF
jgi:hypothetical protein